MSKKLNSEQTGEAVVVAVRLPPHLLAGLDRVVARVSNPPFSMPTRSEVARGLIETALRASGDLEAKPTHTKATATTPSKPAPTPKVPTLPPIENAVLAALKANEQPGADLLDVAAVVRNLEAQGHERTAIHAELVRLGTAGVDVLELRPDSGNGNERQEDRAIVPKGLDGVPLLTARLLKRTEPTPSPEHDSDALRARLKAYREKTGKTERQVADACGIQKDRMNRWTNGTKKTLSPDDAKKLDTYLTAEGA